jgi:hypothetical protein
MLELVRRFSGREKHFALKPAQDLMTNSCRDAMLRLAVWAAVSTKRIIDRLTCAVTQLTIAALWADVTRLIAVTGPSPHRNKKNNSDRKLSRETCNGSQYSEPA